MVQKKLSGIEYSIPQSICFRCALYEKPRQCAKAMQIASNIKGKGVCHKLEYALIQERKIHGDPQEQANKLMAKIRREQKSKRMAIMRQ